MDLTSITLLLYGQCNNHTHTQTEKYPTYLDHAGWYTNMKPFRIPWFIKTTAQLVFQT